jgi:hypothetical protein
MDSAKRRAQHPTTNSVLDELTGSDLIIIPNGSIANWLSLINSSQQVKEILRIKGGEGKLVLLANLFYDRNEFPLESYLELIIDNYQIPLLVLGPNKLEWNQMLQSNPEIIELYKRQNKKPNYSNSNKMKVLYQNPHLSINSCLGLAYGPTVEGLKYNTDSIISNLHNTFPSLI